MTMPPPIRHRLGDVTPMCAFRDATDGGLTHVKLTGKGSLGHTSAMQVPDRTNIVVAQFRCALAHTKSVATFPCLINHVVGVCSREEMVGVEAIAYVTTVQNPDLLVGYKSECVSTVAMDHPSFALVVDMPVAVRIEAAIEQPAEANRIDVEVVEQSFKSRLPRSATSANARTEIAPSFTNKPGLNDECRAATLTDASSVVVPARTRCAGVRAKPRVLGGAVGSVGLPAVSTGARRDSMRTHSEPPTRCATLRGVSAPPEHSHAQYTRNGDVL